VGDVLEDHRLADTVRTNQDCVLALLDEAKSHELVDAFSVEFRWPFPVEVGHCLEGTDGGRAKAALATTALSVALFDVEHLVQPGLVCDVVPATKQSKQTQLLQPCFHRVRTIHCFHPLSCGRSCRVHW